ncbi:efflux RND transporter periplasmic adaptor subunit [Novilysobacter erysipheiresistens]|uniref:DUF2007 domain-containing protein n=1 Tax=Novilysobacter erysipheiresistens TaxID=1749332 RepID=A0ABU7YWM7_9GAMM
MRKVFSSQRLENVEGVARLLGDAGIEVRITDGRSYHGNRRGTFSYSDRSNKPMPAVWVVRSEQQMQARELLREAGLLDSTRPEDGYASANFRFQSEATADDRSPAQKRARRFKVGLIVLIVAIAGIAMWRSLNAPVPVPQLAAGPFDGSVAATLRPVAHAVFASELAEVDTEVACLGVDDDDASIELIQALHDALPALQAELVQASACVELADEDRGSFHRRSGQPAMIVEVRGFKPSAPDRGTIEYSAYHHRMWASYKTLEVARVEGRWQVVDVVKHVRSRGVAGF